MEIHLRTLLFVFASLLGSLSLPFVVDAVPSGAQTAAVQVLPTPTPVPLRGLSAQAQEMVLRAPTPMAMPETRTFAVVATNGVNLNLRGGPGVDASIVGSAAPGTRLPILATSPDGAWIQVEIEGGEAVWVYAELVRLENE
ncbi:SH3 domain-containing protein [bacterium]|nr:SH3 domain-containing protein [bacterium]